MIVTSQLSEKREYKRTSYRYPIRFEFKDPRFFGGSLSYDISEGGICLNLNEFVPLGTELNLFIVFPDHKEVECGASVAWVEKLPFNEQYRVGLRFQKTDAYFDFIHKFNKAVVAV